MLNCLSASTQVTFEGAFTFREQLSKKNQKICTLYSPWLLSSVFLHKYTVAKVEKLLVPFPNFDMDALSRHLFRNFLDPFGPVSAVLPGATAEESSYRSGKPPGCCDGDLVEEL